MTDLSIGRPKFKPFKSPLLANGSDNSSYKTLGSKPLSSGLRQSQSQAVSHDHASMELDAEPAAKRRRVSDDRDSEDGPSGPSSVSKDVTSATPPTAVGRPPSWQNASKIRPSSQTTEARRPLSSVSNPPSSSSATGESTNGPSNDDASDQAYFSVLFRKLSAKMHKTWDGDGFLVVQDFYAHLKDEKGKDIGRGPCKRILQPEALITIGGKEIEVQDLMSRAEYLAAVRGTVAKSPPKPTLRDMDSALKLTVQRPAQPRALSKVENEAAEDASKSHKPLHAPPIQTKSVVKQFKNPQLEPTVSAPKAQDGAQFAPRFDPSAPGALVMKRPSATSSKQKSIVDVVVDPCLSRHLREHQREGVKFLYECIMGMRSYAGDGAILADEMGLGKTLQIITLIWTLLKQTPHPEAPGRGVIKKVLIVCPVTLVKNWRKEFRKWLGRDGIGIFIMDDKKSNLKTFTATRGAYPVMVVGYEKFRSISDDLQKDGGVDLVIADEGHRLKTAQNKCAQAIKSLSTTKKIILSGTPLQNDLSEFYFMVDFVNPGVLGKPGTFRRDFENPIMKGRQPGAAEKDVEKSEGQSEALSDLTSMFILRRTADILAKYLPPKTEYVLMCKPTAAQLSVYQTVLQSPMFSDVLKSSEAALQLITILKKLCNSPSLLKAPTAKAKPNKAAGEDDNGETASAISTLLDSISPNLLRTPAASGKLQVLDSFLHHVRNKTDEKVVLVSHYTSTLNLLSNLLDSLGYSWLRLDGATSATKRQENIDLFNRSPPDKFFAFLMSAKAGGTGINLVGASRLVLFDIDWNPSTELQAMARIHRDGQKRHCRIYRFITAGLLDEKIWQRQLSKMSLADSVMDQKKGAASFSREELRALFKVESGDHCRTHEIIGCPCKQLGDIPEAKMQAEPDDIGAESEQEAAPYKGLMPASKYNAEEQQKLLTQTKAGHGMHALMSWAHFNISSVLDTGSDAEWHDIEAEDHGGTLDAAKATAEDIFASLDDDILAKVLEEKENRVTFVFSKNGGGEVAH